MYALLQFLLNNLLAICLLIVMIWFIAGKRWPSFLGGKSRNNSRGFISKDEAFNANKAARQKELDRILDKINAKGMEAITEAEKAFLKRFN
jgi:hypothetical protein